MKSSTGVSKGNNQTDAEDEEKADLPLLDEVTELLHKERSLLELKLLEQHVHAKGWKDKYESLVTEIGHAGLTPAQLTAYEVAAEVDSTAPIKAWRSGAEKQLYLLSSSERPWYLDLSHTSLGTDDLHRVLMFPKTNNYTQTRVINFHDCGLDDSCSKLFPHLLRYPNIQAIDFSCNDVSDSFHAALIAAVEAKRLKLQYFLLDGNMQLANFPLENLLHHLSSAVWGFTVSLCDVVSWTAAATAVKTPSSTSKQEAATSIPKHSARFLKHLNHILDPKKGSQLLTGNNSKDTMQRKKNSEFLQPHRGAGGAQGGPQAICVLGLKHTILSDDSLNQLETTLKLTVSSLTDLDLSYSFVGIKGAKIIGKILRHRSSQLVRLNLMGNALGDEPTASLLCPGLKTSQTLTYLDMKSNNLTDSGLRALTNALSSKLTFRKLLVEGNSLTLAAVLRARSSLMISGAPHIVVDFGVALRVDSVPMRKKTVEDADEPVFVIPGQASTELDPLKGSAVLYTIESRSIKVFGGSDNTSGVIDRVPGEENLANEGEIRVTWNMNLSTLAVGLTSLNPDTVQHCPKANLGWEMKLIDHAGQERLLGSKMLLPDACLPVGSFVACSACIPKPPFRTKLQITVKVLHSKAVKTISRALLVKSHGLKIFAVPQEFSRTLVPYGGDMPLWSATTNSLLRCSVAAVGIPEGFEVVRKLSWAGQHTFDIRFRFQAKLSAVYSVKDVHGEESVLDSTWKMTEGSVIGYSWCICRSMYHDRDNFTVVAKGVVSQNRTENTEEKDSDSAGSLLQPWLWQKQDVTINEAATNETFILCVRVQSDPPVQYLEKKCKVTVAYCKFFVSGENFDHRKDLAYEYHSNPTHLFNAFNSDTVKIAL